MYPACRRFSSVAVLVIGMSLLAATGPAAEESLSPLRFAKQIEAFARQDLKSPPKAGVIVFVGSSSIRRWNLAKSFGTLNAVNRGFGGSQISDVLHYANEVVLKYQPKKVVFFCGGNDLNKGKPPRQVAADFQTFANLLFELLPETELIVLALKPAPVRRSIVDKVRTTNDLLRAKAKKEKRITFLDGSFNLLLDGGKIREELYVEDRLHLNDEGYKLWADLLAPYLALEKRDGEKQFRNYCAACHGRGGQGEEGRVPPLDDSPWVSGSDDRLIRIVLNGLRGPIEIGGEMYNLEMPAFRMLFQDDDIASMLSYVRQQYGTRSPPVTSETVTRVREETQNKTGYWTVEQLLKFP